MTYKAFGFNSPAKKKAIKKKPVVKAVGYLVTDDSTMYDVEALDRNNRFFDHIPTSDELTDTADQFICNVDALKVFRLDKQGTIKLATTVTF